jgi:hypothetical protein
VVDTLWADVSEWQVPVNDEYFHPVICIRSNDGTYRDKNWHANYSWTKSAVDRGKLAFFQVYFVWHENWWDGVAVLKEHVGHPHPNMAIMLDVESWGGDITGNQSEGINAAFEDLAAWLGDRRRVIGYGNQGDLDSLWPQRPPGCRLIVAKYSTTRPDYPGQIGHQYTDGSGYGTGPQGAPPFGNCDMNWAYGLSPEQFAAELGIGAHVVTPVEKVLNYDHNIVGQETGYNCGPAAAQVTLSCRGIFVPESQLAQECGTHTGGTDYIGLIENCLDPRLPEANYTSVDAHYDPPPQDQVEKFWDGLLRSINSGYAVVMNWVVPASNRPVGIKGSQSPNYGNKTTYHYVTAVGYDSNPSQRAVCIADSGFQPPQYWITLEQCATLIPPKAACYANLPHTGTPGTPAGEPDYNKLGYEQFCGPVDPNTGYGMGWPQLGQNSMGNNLYLVDALADVLHLLEGGEVQDHNHLAVEFTGADDIDYDQLAYEQQVGVNGTGWPQLGGRTITDAVAHIKAVLGGTTPPFRLTPEGEEGHQRKGTHS